MPILREREKNFLHLVFWAELRPIIGGDKAGMFIYNNLCFAAKT